MSSHGDHDCDLNDKTEDPRLRNWAKWLGKREEFAAMVGEKLERNRGELLMNSTEERRGVVEDQRVFDLTKITTTFDKYRGNPAFYQLPLALTSRKNQPDYFAVQKPEHLNTIPTLDYVGVPDKILEEKNLLPRTRNMYTLWQNLHYRRQKFDKFKSKIHHIQPHKPQMEDLIVIGRKIQEDDSDTQAELTESHLSNDETVNESHEVLVDQNPIFRLNLEINGTSLTSSLGDRVKFRLNFDYDVNDPVVHIQYLTFINKGFTTLRLYWHKIEKFHLFQDLIREKCDKFGFSFDKNELLLLPGGRVGFPIRFRTENADVYTETWEITSKPQIWNEEAIKVLVILQAVSRIKNMKEKIDETMKIIEDRSKLLLIRGILDDCLKIVRYDDDVVRVCEFRESRVFESVNFENGQPLFLYNQKIVEKLKKFYREFHKSCDWDFSVENLKEIARIVDVQTYIEEKLNTKLPATEIEEEIGDKGTEEKKKKKTKGKRNKKEKSDTSKSSKSKKSKKGKEKKDNVGAQVDVELMVARPINLETFTFTKQTEFDDLVRNLDVPLLINHSREKSVACVAIFSSYFTKICHMFDDLEREFNVYNCPRYPTFINKLMAICDQPNRHIYELFDECYGPKSEPLVRDYEFEPKQKPKNLEQIPPDDLELVYVTYFNLSLSDLKKNDDKVIVEKVKGKKKNSKKKGSKKSSEKSAKIKKSKTKKQGKKPEEKKIEEIVPFFDPYSEDFIFEETTEELNENQPKIGRLEVPDNLEANFKRNLYISIYSCLTQAVDGLLMTADAYNCEVSYRTIQETRKCLEKTNI